MIIITIILVVGTWKFRINFVCYIQGIDFKDDWKLLTVWIGTEDLCQVCKDAVWIVCSLLYLSDSTRAVIG